ncbi:hypothetical protein EON65_15840 [archaeon]|nr:MAG: hypothetical protein EON65_15840 [archaeon]
MRGFLTGLGDLKQSLLDIVQGDSVTEDEVLSQVRKLNEKSGDLPADLEIIFRSVLANLINSLPPKVLICARQHADNVKAYAFL